MEEYLLFKQKIDKFNMFELVQELEYQISDKIIFKFVSKDQKKMEIAEQKIFLLKVKILELGGNNNENKN